MRMADILRKVRAKQESAQQDKDKSKDEKKPVSPQPKKEEEKKAAPPSLSPIVRAYRDDKSEQPKIKSEKTEALKPADGQSRSSKVVKYSYEESLKLYEETLIMLKQLLKEDIDYLSVDINKINMQVEKIVEQMRLGNEHLLYFAFTRGFKEEDYLSYHSLNVCIYSMEIGIGLVYDKYKLHELGLLAVLHDLKMVDHKNLIKQPRKLTKEEFNKIKEHARDGAELVEKMIKGYTKIKISAITQHHERVDGTGYPNGLHGDEIDEYAKIISLIDTFEAGIHPRTYRNAYLASQALQEIINTKDKYEYRLIKILIDRIGMFPVGCIVKLSSKEIAQVIKMNYDRPMTPVVQVLFLSSGRPLKERRIIDLKKSPEVIIKRELNKEDVVKLQDKLLAKDEER
ncbi:MAG: HD domain-containing protein [Candidatus Omnitrophica bacterium]|nr:HD domain-containing protein [Candidatus Omnitrophota bacterium]